MAKPKTKKSKQYMITPKLKNGEFKFKAHRSKSANTNLMENFVFVGESKSRREKKIFLDNLKALSSLY